MHIFRIPKRITDRDTRTCGVYSVCITVDLFLSYLPAYREINRGAHCIGKLEMRDVSAQIFSTLSALPKVIVSFGRRACESVPLGRRS